MCALGNVFRISLVIGNANNPIGRSRVLGPSPGINDVWFGGHIYLASTNTIDGSLMERGPTDGVRRSVHQNILCKNICFGPGTLKTH